MESVGPAVSRISIQRGVETSVSRRPEVWAVETVRFEASNGLEVALVCSYGAGQVAATIFRLVAWKSGTSSVLVVPFASVMRPVSSTW